MLWASDQRHKEPSRLLSATSQYTFYTFLFNKTLQNHMLHTHTLHGCGRRYTYRYCLQSWPFNYREPVENFEKRRDNVDIALLQHLSRCLKEEWDGITPEAFHQMVLPEWWHYKVGRAWCVAGLKCRNGCLLTNKMKLSRQNMKYLGFRLSESK